MDRIERIERDPLSGSAEKDSKQDLFKEGYQKALDLIYDCASDDGFLASPTDKTNYRRVWGRDGIILGISALMTGETDLVETARKTLQTMADHQGPHGEIPSNVDTTGNRISYGGMAGRVDSNLWFIIGCGEYWKATGDESFLERMIPAMEKVRFLLGAWEYNNRGLLYIPETGDWADEYIHSGYVLYDQLLYLQALRTIAEVRKSRQGTEDHLMRDRINRLRHLVRANYWFIDGDETPEDVYHGILYKKGRKSANQRATHYWAPFFSPHGYGYRFDSLANVLASLLGVSNDERKEEVEGYIRSEIMTNGEQLLPAFYPVINPMDQDWGELNMTFSYTFKNNPHEYHNGGLWPMISGFYVADLVHRGAKEAALSQLKEIHKANRLEMEGEPWSFPEYVHGLDRTAGGTRHQGWSAAGAIIGHFALEGKPFFRIGGDDA